MASNAFCTIQVNDTVSAAALYTNTTSAITSNEAAPGIPASASITANAPTPATLAKTFGAGSITVGQSTSLTFTLANPNAGISLTGLSFNDTLPAGMVVSTPNGLTATCAGGTVTGTAGTGLITVNGEALGPNAFCTIQVNVTISAASLYTNTTSAITSNQAAPGAAGNDHRERGDSASVVASLRRRIDQYRAEHLADLHAYQSQRGARCHGVSFTNPSGRARGRDAERSHRNMRGRRRDRDRREW